MRCQFLYLDLQGWANLATVLGIAFAVTTLALAYIQYRSSLRAASLSHVNSLFRDLLRLEFDYYNSSSQSSSDRASARARLGSYRMWVLEELWLWIEAKKRDFGRMSSSGENAVFIDNWLETLNFHARRNSTADWIDFQDAKGCYHPEFVAYVSALRPAEPSAGPSLADHTVRPPTQPPAMPA